MIKASNIPDTRVKKIVGGSVIAREGVHDKSLRDYVLEDLSFRIGRDVLALLMQEIENPYTGSIEYGAAFCAIKESDLADMLAEAYKAGTEDEREEWEAEHDG